jgi:hypothetical protein
MSQMGKYCKAYPVNRFREFKSWSENTQNLRRVKSEQDGKEVEVARTLTEDDFLYLQENFTVTDGIFLNENVVFEEVTPEWMEFCKATLEFEVPQFETKNAEAAEQ